MPRKTPTLSKLSRPRLHNAVVRERLFAKLDEAQSHPTICVVGPPGAGKTTLVASWLDARGIKGIWYQIDAGDADAASFFHYLGLAAGPLVPSRLRLPTFAPEYRNDVAGFARRYFRTLFESLPADSVVVLDNLQDAGLATTLYQVLTVAAVELPNGFNLVAISREKPPEAFARLTANRLLFTIDWDDLRLTLQETERIAGALLPSRTVKAQELHEQCQGWVAGLTLMLERAKHTDEVEAMNCPDTRETIFRYFAGQILTVATKDEQRFLMRSAFLPRATVAMAAALSGDSLAGERLESLHRRHLFTHRQGGKDPFYVYHALFRNFLLTRAETEISSDERAGLWARSGEILEQSSQLEDAVEAYSRAGKWNALQSLIEREAPDLISQGRAATLRVWINRVPRDRVAKSAWLQYWLASAIAQEDAMTALAEFDRAHALFVDTGESNGQIRALCGIVEAIFFAATNHAIMDPWIPVLKEAVSRMKKFQSGEIELRAYAALLIATLFRQPSSEDLAHIAKRTLELLDSDAPANQRMTAASFLMVYCTFTGHFALAAVVRGKTDAIVASGGITPHNRGIWALWKCYLYQILFEAEQGIQAAREAEEIGEAYGLSHIVFLSRYFRSGIEAKAGNLVEAEQSVAKALAFVIPSRRLQVAQGNACSAWFAVYANRPRLALEHGRLAMSVARELGSPSYLIHYGMPFLFGLVETRALDEARTVLAEQRKITKGTAIACFEPLLMCAEARIAELAGNPQAARKIIEHMWPLARIEDHGRYLGWMTTWMPRYAALALDAGVECEYVAGLVRHYRWSPPHMASDRWPWPVKIYTLGRFEVLVDGHPLEFGRKTPKKPLTLLKAIIALGGENVSESKLLDLVWPDQEGDAAGRVLDVTLHRLRNWLKRGDALRQKDGKLSLNADCCWVDARQFEHGTAGPDAENPDRVLALYKGGFLPQDGDLSWALGYRERLRTRFVNVVTAAGRLLESEARHDPAIALYLRGIEADDLVEAFYQGLMRCYQQLGRVPEAMGAYRRLKQTLSVTLGVPPCAASESLFQSLRPS